MKKYGLRIGNVGVEFISTEERNKALQEFTRGADVIISDSGLRFREGQGSFSIYDRDTKDIITNCCICKGVFEIDACREREYPHKSYWDDNYSTLTGYICDACIARKEKDQKIFKAKKLIKNESNED